LFDISFNFWSVLLMSNVWIKSSSAVYLAAFGLAAALSGCSQQTLNSAKQDTQRNIANAKPQIAKLELGSRVTAALAAANVHGVRVDADTNGVSLHGIVNSAAQEKRAVQIARDTLGPGRVVNNQLEVSGGE
jgi:hypothetical protein